jgi:hypothetical protein
VFTKITAVHFFQSERSDFLDSRSSAIHSESDKRVLIGKTTNASEVKLNHIVRTLRKFQIIPLKGVHSHLLGMIPNQRSDREIEYL